jgi:hypothetical protein
MIAKDKFGLQRVENFFKMLVAIKVKGIKKG